MIPPRRTASEAGTNPAAEPNPAVLRILEDYLDQLEQGVPAHPEELLARHPEVADLLQEYLASLQFLHRTALKLRSTDESGDLVHATGGEDLGQLGDYRLIREIGRGGMGVVYEAQQISLNRPVALKVLPFAATLEGKHLQRFKNEAQAAAILHHQNIVPVYGVGCERGVHYYAMQFIEGRTLATMIRELRQLGGLAAADEAELAGQRDDPVTDTTPKPASAFATESSTHSPAFFRTAARLGVQAAGALDYAHQFGVIHRDIKPANLLVDVRGDLWITDFGLAQVQSDTRLTMTGDLVGTLRYMSPEQALGKRVAFDHRTDIYSLGATLYELLTLEPVFAGQDREELLRQIAFEEPKPPRRIAPEIPAELETIVLKAVAKNPEERYASAKDLSEDLGRFLNDEPIRAKRPTLPQRGRKWARRHQPIVVTAAVALVALFVMALVGSLVSNTLIRHERDQARNAALLAKHRLLDAKLAQARASRWGRQVGQRFASLQAVTDAAQLARELNLDEERRLELRNEAIACLALSDIRLIKEWEGWPAGSAGLAFDADLERYAYSDARGNISVRRVTDDRELARLPGESPVGPNTGAPFLLFSPDGNLLAARHHRKPGQTGNLRVWDWRHGRIVFQPAFTLDWFGVDFSPDGRHFTLIHPGGVLTIREATTGNEVRRMSVGSPLSLAAWSPDGSKVATISSRGGEVQVRDVATGRLLQNWPTPAFVWSLAWHPDGSLLATACDDTQVYVWEAATGQPHAVLRGHTASAAFVAFSPRGDTLLSSGWDGTSRLWDVWTGRELVRFASDVNRFSRDSRRLVSRTGSRLDIWELSLSQEYRALPWSPITSREDTRSGGSLSINGRWLGVPAGDAFRLWDIKSGRPLASLPTTHAVMTRFHPLGQELFTSGHSGLYRWPWHMESSVLRIGPPSKLPVAGLLEEVSLDREGRILAVARLGRVNGGASVLDPENPTEVRQIAHALALYVAVSPDGRWVATGGRDGGGVKVWDAQSGQLVRHLIPNERILHVTFCPQGRCLVTGTVTEFIIWEVASWQQTRRLAWEPGVGGAGNAAFTPDGKLLAITVSPSVIELIDAVTWRPLARLQGPDTDPVMLPGFTPDGSRLFVVRTAGGVRVWDLRWVREQLKSLGLDWDMPPYPPETSPGDTRPLRVEVDLGELGQAKKE
jgi:serine/threonine protein kinase/WD40 repeat protein